MLFFIIIIIHCECTNKKHFINVVVCIYTMFVRANIIVGVLHVYINEKPQYVDMTLVHIPAANTAFIQTCNEAVILELKKLCVAFTCICKIDI